MRKRLTVEILLRNGWERHGEVMVLRASPRFGWYADTGKLIVGYTEVPFLVKDVEDLQAFLDVFRTGKRIYV